jgi:hypothetical protein
MSPTLSRDSSPVEPERIIAGVALLLTAALAAVAGGLGILVSPILGFAPPEVFGSLLLTVAVLWALALTVTVLVAFVMTGRHSQLALAIATVLVACAVAALSIDGAPLTFGLLAVGGVTAGALLIGTLRHHRR